MHDTIEKHYLLDFDPVVEMIETGFATLTMYQRQIVSVKEYIFHLLEWLCEKIDYHNPCGAAENATIYLKTCGINEEWARIFSNEVLDVIMMQVCHTFPQIDYRILNHSRFIFDGFSTLNVYIKEKVSNEVIGN